MKKTLLTLSLVLTFAFTHAQNLITENFNAFPVVGWQTLNLSVPVGTTGWFAGNPVVFSAQAGATNSYIGANFNNTTGANTISNWIFSPDVSLIDGDVITFWSREATGNTFPDNLQMRVGPSSGAAPVGNTGIGGYTTLALEINPTLIAGVYPQDWTQFTYTVTGLPTATLCKVAFRYFVTGGGPSGANSNYIGIDTFSIDRPAASTDDFFASNFSVYPNPVKDILNLSSKNGAFIETIQVLDINGRIVNQINASSESVQVNVSDLNTGVYFVKVQSELGVGTTKIIKN